MGTSQNTLDKKFESFVSSDYEDSTYKRLYWVSFISCILIICLNNTFGIIFSSLGMKNVTVLKYMNIGNGRYNVFLCDVFLKDKLLGTVELGETKSTFYAHVTKENIDASAFGEYKIIPHYIHYSDFSIVLLCAYWFLFLLLYFLSRCIDPSFFHNPGIIFINLDLTNTNTVHIMKYTNILFICINVFPTLFILLFIHDNSRLKLLGCIIAINLFICALSKRKLFILQKNIQRTAEGTVH